MLAALALASLPAVAAGASPAVATPATAVGTAPADRPTQFLELLNASRTAVGLAPVVLDAVLSGVAATWSLHMAGVHARTGDPIVKAGHEHECEVSSLCHRPDLVAAVTLLAPGWTRVGENIGYGGSVTGVHDALMASPAHRDNIVGPWDRVGIGVTEDPISGHLWVTFDFASGAAPVPPPAVVAVRAGGRFRAVAPQRLADSRTGAGGVTGPLRADQVVRIDLGAGAGPGRGAPADAVAAVVNLTATGVQRPGYLTAYPCGTARPLASSLNVAVGETRANEAVVALDSTRALCLYTSAPLDVVIDGTGWFAPDGDGYRPVTPARVLDTRDGGRLVTDVAVAVHDVLGHDATAVVANVTVTNPLGAGFVTAYPCDMPLPLASNVNFAAGQTVANLATVKLGTGSTLCVHSSSPTHLVVDVAGGFAPGATSALTSVVPARLLDTRDATGGWTGPVAAGQRVELAVAGRRGVPTGARAVAVNLTATDTAAAGYVVAFPCDGAVPMASNVNFRAGETAATMAVVRLSSDGALCLRSSAGASLVVDVAGWFTD